MRRYWTDVTILITRCCTNCPFLINAFTNATPYNLLSTPSAQTNVRRDHDVGGRGPQGTRNFVVATAFTQNAAGERGGAVLERGKLFFTFVVSCVGFS